MEIKSLVYSVLSNPKLYDLSCYCIIEHMSKLVLFGVGGVHILARRKNTRMHIVQKASSLMFLILKIRHIWRKNSQKSPQRNA